MGYAGSVDACHSLGIYMDKCLIIIIIDHYYLVPQKVFGLLQHYGQQSIQILGKITLLWWCVVSCMHFL